MKSVREALTGWWAIFGILVTATTVFNLLDNTFHLNDDQWLALVLAGYQKVFHFPFRVCEYFLPIVLPIWLKDVLVLWSIGAAATLRANRKTRNTEDFKTRFSLWRSITHPEWRHKVTYKNLRISIVLGFYHPLWQLVVVFVTWPRILYLFFSQEPYLYQATDPAKATRHYVYTSKRAIPARERDGYRLLFDMRIVLATQLGTAVLAACALAMWLGLDKERAATPSTTDAGGIHITKPAFANANR